MTTTAIAPADTDRATAARDYAEYASAPHYTLRAGCMAATTHITLDDHGCNHYQAFCRTCRQTMTVQDMNDTCPQCSDWLGPTFPINNCTCETDRIKRLATHLAPILGNGLVNISDRPFTTARRFLSDPYHAVDPTGLARQDWYIENDTIIVTIHDYTTGHNTTHTISPLFPNTADEELPYLKKVFAID